MQFCYCGFKNGSYKKKNQTLRIATKYTNYTQRVLKTEIKIEIIKLNGSVELAPLLDLSDVIVDIVETGKNLKRQWLGSIRKTRLCSARLIANKASYRFKYNIIKKIERILGVSE